MKFFGKVSIGKALEARRRGQEMSLGLWYGQ